MQVKSHVSHSNTIDLTVKNSAINSKNRNAYYHTETILKPGTPAFIMGHFTKGSNGDVELTTKPLTSWWNIPKQIQQPLIIDNSETERISWLQKQAKGFHFLSVILVTVGVGAIIYDNTKFTSN
jgi:hypothetical protein